MPSPSPPLRPDAKILIIGAGVFGLSTTLHLLKRGYTNIHLFDHQPLDRTYYSELHGASSDINKILRASYGGRKLYQDLAFRAMPEWRRWNDELARCERGTLPPCLDPEVKLWHDCGFWRGSSDGLEESEVATQKNFPAELRGTQYRVGDAERREQAIADGVPMSKVDPFRRLQRGLPTDGVLDMTAGYVLASRACAWALHLCMKSGFVTTHFGADNGLQSLMKTKDRVTGIVTTGIERHSADLVVVACGGWTPSLIPETQHLLETTAGSVLSIQLPPHRRDLWHKYNARNFPVWSWNMGGYTPAGASLGGIYGMPASPEGILKLAFRGAKWTSYTRRAPSGEAVSYPDPDADRVPAEAMRVLRGFVAENMPELLALDLADCRLCWYTDSVDDDWLVDRVPGTEALVVASGGSGHGFKFLPVLGEHVVDVVERKETEYTRLFRWRPVPGGERNGLEEGPGGWRTLGRQRMVGNREWRGRGSSRL